MKKTLLTLALVFSSVTANQQSKECSYLNNMTQNQILSVPTDKSKIQSHMDCLFEFVAKDQNKQLKNKRIDKNTVFGGVSYNKKTNTLKSINVVNDIAVSTLKQNTAKAKAFACSNQIFSTFMPHGLSMKTAFKDQEGKELYSFEVSKKDCK